MQTGLSLQPMQCHSLAVVSENVLTAAPNYLVERAPLANLQLRSLELKGFEGHRQCWPLLQLVGEQGFFGGLFFFSFHLMLAPCPPKRWGRNEFGGLKLAEHSRATGQSSWCLSCSTY